MLQELLTKLTQTETSGGMHTPPEARLLLLALALEIKAKDILETGFDAGYTTLALAMTGANVTGVDNNSEYSDAKAIAYKLLATYPNAKLINGDAIVHLYSLPDESLDLAFIDDDHQTEHVILEMKQIRRVLRPGGICAFHDTIYHRLGDQISIIFPDWYYIPYLQCYSPHPELCTGKQIDNFGIGIIQKPYTITYR